MLAKAGTNMMPREKMGPQQCVVQEMHATVEDLGPRQLQPAMPPAEVGQQMAQGHLKREGAESMQNRYEARPHRDEGLPTWRPQPGEVLTGVIDRYTISETPQGLVRAVIVTEARTGERVCLRLASTSLLALFAQHQPHPGERIDVRYRWHAPGHGYQRWRLLMARWRMRGMDDLTVEALARLQQTLNGWIGQRAPHPERPRLRPRVMTPNTAHPA
jgi:hypothetical protein